MTYKNARHDIAEIKEMNFNLKKDFKKFFYFSFSFFGKEPQSFDLSLYAPLNCTSGLCWCRKFGLDVKFMWLRKATTKWFECLAKVSVASDVIYICCECAQEQHKTKECG